MIRTITKSVDLRRFAQQGKSAATVIKLMMACNDMQLANEALAEWKKEQPRHRKGREAGARMYFVRLQVSHLYEALKIVEQIRGDRSLMLQIESCDRRTQNSFQKPEPFLPGGDRQGWFQKMAGRLRHNLAFHYDGSGKLIEKAISDRTGRSEARHSSVTRGSTAYLWHFKPADDIVDSIVLRQIWGVPRDKDLRTEVDKIADDIHRVFLHFTDFAGEFIWRYCDHS